MLIPGKFDRISILLSGLLFSLLLFNATWLPKLVHPVSFEDSIVFFYRGMLSKYIKNGSNFGAFAPQRIIFACGILEDAARRSNDPAFKLRADSIKRMCDYYLLMNMHRADWQNFEVHPSQNDAIVSRGEAVPESMRQQDDALLEQILLATIID